MKKELEELEKKNIEEEIKKNKINNENLLKMSNMVENFDSNYFMATEKF